MSHLWDNIVILSRSASLRLRFCCRALPRDVVLDHEGSVQLDRAALRRHLEDRLADLVNLESAAIAANELQLGHPIMFPGVELRRLPRPALKLGGNKLRLQLKHVELSQPDQPHAHGVGKILLTARAALALRHDFLNPFEFSQLYPTIRRPHQISGRINEPIGEQTLTAHHPI